MAKVLITEGYLSDIADAIREKKSSQDTYTPAEMADAIESIPSGTAPTGTINISTNGTHDVTDYANANVSVPTGTARSSSDLTASNLTVTAPAGLYAENATKTLSDQNLVAGNIKKDVTIFGTTGTYEGSGGYSLDDIAEGAITGAITLTADSVEEGVFTYNTRLTSVTANGAISLKGHAFYYCSYVTKVFMPSCTINGHNSMEGMSRLQTAVIGNLNTGSNWYLFKSCTALTAVDIVGTGSLTQQAFMGCTNLATIILRSSSIIGLVATNVFDNSPFKSGGSGGTIYIPKSLYDHLGDGTSNDYKTATNWSTIDGRGVITWAKIEGSIYENQYADGTPISS